jgi:hypothetical protein
MHETEDLATPATKRVLWNKGKLIGARPPLRPKHAWTIRTKLQMEKQTRDLALFNLAIDSKLRSIARAEVGTVREVIKLDDPKATWSAPNHSEQNGKHIHSPRRLCQPAVAGAGVETRSSRLRANSAISTLAVSVTSPVRPN